MAESTVSQDGTYAIEIVRGQGFDLELSYQAPSDDGTWVPIPRPGWSGRGQVRDSPGGKLLLEFEVIVSQETTGPDVGTIRVHASGEATAVMRRGGYWDLELVDHDGIEDQVISLSPVTLTKQVTQ